MAFESKNPRVLVVDDDRYLLEVFQIALEVIHFEIESMYDPSLALEAIREKEYDMVFLDMVMTPIDGMQLLKEVKRLHPNTTVIIISGNSSMDEAIKAVDLGAYHILQKPVHIKDLQFFAKKTWEYHTLVTELRELKERTKSRFREKIITVNKAFLKSIDTALDVAESDINILLQGESGTGKEMLAELIHEKSKRSNQPLVKIHCTGTPDNVLEERFFGDKLENILQGNTKLQGAFGEAIGGTLLIDEIGDMSTDIQSKLLSFFQDREEKNIKIDIRIISTTTIDLDETIQEKSFKEDLYFRLNQVLIKTIPLRDRPEDIDVLARHFMKEFSNKDDMKIKMDAVHLMKSYRWPGNVREFQNVIKRACVLVKNDYIEQFDLPDEIQFSRIESDKHLITLEELEIDHIKKVLNRTTDFRMAARILGIDTATLWRKRKKYSI